MFKKNCASNIILQLKPSKKVRSLPLAEKFIRILGKGIHAFEVWSIGKICQIFICSSNYDVARKIASLYPCEIYYSSKKFPFSNLDDFNVGYLTLSRNYCPIDVSFDFDPLDILLKMISGFKAIYQVVFTEINNNKLFNRIFGVLKDLRDNKTTSELTNKANYPFFKVSIRVAINSKLDLLEDFFKFFNNYKLNQIFKIKKINNKNKAFRMMTSRCMEKCIILSSLELSYLAHIPGSEITAKNVEFSTFV